MNLLTLPKPLDTHLDFSGVGIAQSIVLSLMFCRSLFVLWSFFVWSLHCLSLLMSYLCYLYLFEYSSVQHVLTIWVIWRVSCKRQELLALSKHLGSRLVLSRVPIVPVSLYYPLWLPLLFPITFICGFWLLLWYIQTCHRN